MSLSSRILWVAVIGAVLAIVGCGDHSNTNLDSGQRLQLALEIQNNVDGAFGGAVGGVHAGIAVGRPRPSILTANCTGSAPETCTIQSGSTVPCAVSGSTGIRGTFSDTTSVDPVTSDLDDDVSAANITLDPVACNEDDFLILDGDDNVVVKVVQGHDIDVDLNNGTIKSGEITEKGHVKFQPVTTGAFPTGSCDVNATISFNNGTETALAGSSICGKTLSVDTILNG